MSHRLLILNPAPPVPRPPSMTGERQTAMKNIVHTTRTWPPTPACNDQLDYRVRPGAGWLAQEGDRPVHPVGGGGPGRHHPQHRTHLLAIWWMTNLADCLRNYPVFDHASNLGADGTGICPASGDPLPTIMTR